MTATNQASPPTDRRRTQCLTKMLQLLLSNLLLVAITAGLTCCGNALKPSEAHPYQMLASSTVSDIEPLSDERPSMQDLAFTFPVFEMGTAEMKKSIRLGDVQIREAVNFWQLLGDGAQSTITLERLTAPDVLPLIVRLSVGPVFDGVGKRSLLHIYRFERISGGWKRIEYKIEKSIPSKI